MMAAMCVAFHFHPIKKDPPGKAITGTVVIQGTQLILTI